MLVSSYSIMQQPFRRMQTIIDVSKIVSDDTPHLFLIEAVLACSKWDGIHIKCYISKKKVFSLHICDVLSYTGEMSKKNTS